MHCENLLVNDRCDRQTVEAVCECLPQLDIIPSLTLVVESVYAVDGSAFMVTTQDKEILRIFYLVCKKKTNSLQRLFASVDIVT